MTEPPFSADLVLRIHALILATTGGAPGPGDRGLLEFALASPFSTFQARISASGLGAGRLSGLRGALEAVTAGLDHPSLSPSGTRLSEPTPLPVEPVTGAGCVEEFLGVTAALLKATEMTRT